MSTRRIRDYQFINGPETSTLPTAGTPTDPSDTVTKSYVDTTFSPLGSHRLLGFITAGLIGAGDIDGWHYIAADRGIDTVRVICGNSGSGTTTVELYVNGSATGKTASLTGTGALAVFETTITSEAVSTGDLVSVRITALATGVQDLIVEHN